MTGFEFATLAGLSGLSDYLLNNWLAPLYFIALAVFAIVFLRNTSWTKIVSFIGVAAVVGVLMFAGPVIFGKDGNITKEATQISKKVGN